MTPFSEFVFKKILNANMRGVEVGVRDGLNAAYLMNELPVKRLFLVDNFPAYDDDARIYNVDDQKGEYEKLLRTILGEDRYVQKSILVNKSSMEAYNIFLNWNPTPYLFDFVYIDADHSLEAVKKDLQWWNLIRNGGVLGGHDYGEHWGRFVKQAVDEFAAENSLKIEVLDKSRGAIEWAIFKG
jgi:predicted O-methyltransferase YrrM